MKKLLPFLVSGAIFWALAGCSPPADGSRNPAASAMETPEYDGVPGSGDKVNLRLPNSSHRLTIIHAGNRTAVDFPTGIDDSGRKQLSRKFLISETEMTNEAAAIILQWAYDRGRFSSAKGSPNQLTTEAAKQGGRILLKLGENACRVDFDGESRRFTARSGFEIHPVAYLSWYGAVMLCNWLTEIRDGSGANAVYTWKDNGDGGGTSADGKWQAGETDEDPSKSGYRLPSSAEWEYAARYSGRETTNTAANFTDPYFTKGNSASGATLAHAGQGAGTSQQVKAANDAVAVYDKYWNGTGWTATFVTDAKVVRSRGIESSNALGLFDMSGNLAEWCFSPAADADKREVRGGHYGGTAEELQIGRSAVLAADSLLPTLGFRIARTAK